MAYTSLFEFWKQIVQFGSFLLSIFFNSLLILLVLTKSPKKMGSYKYLMCYFSLFSMAFSTMDIVLQPYLLSHGTCFIVLTDLRDSFLNFRAEHGNVMISMLCGCFGGVISGIAIHFVFRYFAMERKGKLVYFEGRYLAGWLSIPLILTVIWSIVTYYYLQPTNEAASYVREYLNETYSLEVDNSSYIAMFYWPIDQNGKMRFNKFIIPSIVFFTVIINASLFVMFYFGVKIYKRIQKLIYEGSSQFTKNLQKQLYKALVVQACIPIFLMYIPIGIYIYLPLLGVDIGFFNTFVTFVYAVYPAVDPLPLIFMVDNYRFAVLRMLCGRDNRVDVEEVTSVSRQISS